MNITTVKAVGDSWVICRSKSHSGHIYYFNTLTGESVWNLSDDELHKAKTKLQNQQNEAEIGCYPEPKEPPSQVDIETPNNNTKQKLPQGTQTDPEIPKPSRVYNKQIINNQFAEHAFQYPPFIAPQVFTPSVAIANSLNPNVWRVPPALLLQSAATSFNGQPQNFNVPFNNQNDNLIQSTTVPLSKRFVNFNDNNTTFDPDYRMKSNFSNNRINKTFRNNAAHKQHQPGFCPPEYDLRTKLMSRIRKNNKFKKTRTSFREHYNFKKNISHAGSDENDGKVEIRNQSVTKRIGFNMSSVRMSNDKVDQEDSLVDTSLSKQNNASKTVNQSKEDYCSDVDSDWLEDNIRVHGNKLELDISSLKSLADPNLNQESWYIAVDASILLGHLNFMNILLNSDEDCKLMVPRSVLVTLRELAEDPKCKPRDSRRARRAVAFISQHLDNNTAIIGEASTDGSNSDYPYVLDCCINLLDENYFVVLLSNDEELEEFKPTTDIPIFSIKQLKHFLSNITNDVEWNQRPIIVVPNHVVKDNNESVRENLNSNRESIDSNDETKGEHEVPDGDQDNPLTETKHTVEAVVQTDSISFEIKQRPSVAKDQDDVYQNSNSNSTHTDIKTLSNTKKIRLKRNTAIVTPFCSNGDKKQFKWRRKRNVSCTQTNESQTSAPEQGKIQNIRSNNTKENCSYNSQTSNVTEFDTGHVNDVGSSSRTSTFGIEEGSETSSSITMQRTSCDKIVIDESSTSVISNSTSNMDSIEFDRYRSHSQTVSQRNEVNFYEDADSAFEVTDLTMKANLETRCDEWISRFVQIMEEVLTQVLQKDSTRNVMPPPWSIQEATECIKIKYNDEKYIVDAATKLLNIFRRVSDTRGRWNQSISPNEFMEIYKCGTYLVKSLKLKLLNFEDLEIALDLLEKLLNEIRNPHLETSHNDNFENPYEICANDTSVSVSKPATLEFHHEHNQNAIKCHKDEDEFQTLHRNSNTQNCIKRNCIKRISFGEEESPNKKADSRNSSVSNDTNKVEPVIIRKFTIVPELEKKLSSKNSSSNQGDTFDDYFLEEERDHEASKCSYGNTDPDVSNESYSRCIVETDTHSPSKEATEIDLEWIYRSTIGEIREIFDHVYNFCENSYKELRNLPNHSSKKSEILGKAQEVHDCIENLIKSLNDIISRETSSFEDILLSQLSVEGVKVPNVDTEQFQTYRNIIAKSIEQANILQDAVNTIMSSV